MRSVPQKFHLVARYCKVRYPGQGPLAAIVLAGAALLVLPAGATPLPAQVSTGASGISHVMTAVRLTLNEESAAGVASLWQSGRDAQLAGRWDDAVNCFSRLLELEPRHLDAIVALGFSYFKKGDLNESEKLYRRALSLNNRHVGAGFGWGQIEMARKNWQNAAALFRDILRIAPDFQPVAARHNLALSLFSLNRYEEAEEVYEQIFEQPASLFSPELFVNALDNEIALNRYRRAVYWGTEGTRIFPEAAALWDRLAWALRRVDEPALSNEAYSRAESLVYLDTTPRHKTVLSLPFRGPWRVIQGNNGRSTHRGLGSRFAWDFQALSPSTEIGKSPDKIGFNGLFPNENSVSPDGQVPLNGQEGKTPSAGDSDWHLKGSQRKRSFENRGGRWRPQNIEFASFGQDVLAPAPGRVVALQDGTPDNEPFHRNPSPHSGNYILIEHTTGEFSSLGHLQNGSIRVKVGDRVERGQIIARCGNSGNTALPHLHYSFIGLYKGSRVSMPAQFSNYLSRAEVPLPESSPHGDRPTRATAFPPTLSPPVLVEAGIPAEGNVVESNPVETAVAPAKSENNVPEK